MNQTENKIYRKGLGLKETVTPKLRRDFTSSLVSFVKAHGNRLTVGGVTLVLAREFGFCYGVERAVDYAYQTREKFPDRRIYLVGNMIHNPFVNQQIREMGIEILPVPNAPDEDYTFLQPEDVVVLPAFGVPVDTLKKLRKRGCVVVDTTCGSVISVWKRVEEYARDGFTVLIHGKANHEETRATVSHALKFETGRYLVVRNEEEAYFVCDWIRGKRTRQEFFGRFAKAVSPNFDPDRDLQKIGLANQTTMLRSESLKIAEMIRQALSERYGEENLEKHFRNFDTVCSATQDRQDAVVELVTKEKVDLMLVVGGFQSSNTGHLAEIAAQFVPTFHIENADFLLSRTAIRHRIPAIKKVEVTTRWLPAPPIRVGITAGASTPNSILGEVIERLFSLEGISLTEIIAPKPEK